MIADDDNVEQQPGAAERFSARGGHHFSTYLVCKYDVIDFPQMTYGGGE